MKAQLEEKNRLLEHAQTELKEIETELKEKEVELKEKEAELAREYEISKELVEYKQLKERNETVYIATTRRYAQQGLFKVGRTTNPSKRVTNHNTSRTVGDKVKIVREFKVNSAVLVEGIIHRKLDGLRPSKGNEYFLIPFDCLVDIIELIIDFDQQENEQVNRIVDTAFRMKRLGASKCDWASGLDMSVFDETLRLMDDDQKELAQFDVTIATEEQKRQFIRQCLEAYQATIQAPMIVWTAFQSFLKKQLSQGGLKAQDYKSKDWKEIVKHEGANGQLSIQWVTKKTT